MGTQLLFVDPIKVNRQVCKRTPGPQNRKTFFSPMKEHTIAILATKKLICSKNEVHHLLCGKYILSCFVKNGKLIIFHRGWYLLNAFPIIECIETRVFILSGQTHTQTSCITPDCYVVGIFVNLLCYSEKNAWLSKVRSCPCPWKFEK